MQHLSSISFAHPHRPRPRRRNGLVVALALGTALSFGFGPAPTAAHADALVVSSPTSITGSWVLHGGELRLLDATGAVDALDLDLPAGADPASLALVGDGWVVAGSTVDAASGVERLFALTGDFDGESARALPVPPAAHAVQHSPVVLVDGGELAALAWLEGDGGRGMAVRAARWMGDHWSAPEPVSPRGPGSQAALHGVTLADGSWLLTWAAFDGVDSEIVWSLHQGSGWLPMGQVSPPNETPDTFPKVIAWDGGARVAWSRYGEDGQRVVTRSFVDGAWGSMETVGGPGTLYPRFQPVGDRLYLLYQESSLATPPPGGRLWTVVETGPDGPLRHARAAVRGLEAPVLSPGLDRLLAPGAGNDGWRSRLRWVEGGPTPASEDARWGGAR